MAKGRKREKKPARKKTIAKPKKWVLFQAPNGAWVRSFSRTQLRKPRGFLR